MSCFRLYATLLPLALALPVPAEAQSSSQTVVAPVNGAGTTEPDTASRNNAKKPRVIEPISGTDLGSGRIEDKKGKKISGTDLGSSR